MTETLFVFLLKLYSSFHHLAVTDTVCIFSFTGAFFLCIYEYIKTLIDFVLSLVDSVF